jgi:hypothetical protein
VNACEIELRLKARYLCQAVCAHVHIDVGEEAN